jgi:DNA primase
MTTMATSNFPQAAIDFLRNRHLTLDILKPFDVCWGDDLQFTSLKNRIVFPVNDQYGDTITYIGRTILPVTDTNVKYMTLSYDKSSIVYNLDKAKNTREAFFFVAEGIFDIVYLSACGFDNVIAALGSSLNVYQASLLKRYKDKVIIVPDNDKPGLAGAKRTRRALESMGIQVTVPPVLGYAEGEDFGDFYTYNPQWANKVVNEWVQMLTTKPLTLQLNDLLKHA